MTVRSISWWVLVWHAVVVIKIHAFQSSSTSRGSVQSPGRKIVPRGFLTTTTRLGGRTRPSSTLSEMSRMRGPHPSPTADNKSMDFWQENNDNNDDNNDDGEFVPAKLLIGTTPSSTSSSAKVEDPAAVSRSSEKQTMKTALLPTMEQFLRDEDDGALLRQVDTTLVGVDAERVFATPPTTTTVSSSLSAAKTNNNNESIHQYSAGHTRTDEEQQQTCSSTLAFNTRPGRSARIGSESAWPPVMDVRAVEHVIAQAALATTTVNDQKSLHGQELCHESHDDTATTPQKPMETNAAVSPTFIGDAVHHANDSIQGTHRREVAAVDSREPSPSIFTARITPEELSSPINEAVPNVADGLQLLSVDTAATESTTAPSVVLTEIPMGEFLTRPIRDSSEPNSRNGFTVALTNGVSSLSLPAMNERDAADTTTVVGQGWEDWNSDAKRMASSPSVPAAETIERKRIGPPEQAPPKHLYWSTYNDSPDQVSNQVFPAASGGHTASNHDSSQVSAGKTIWSGIAQPGKTSFFPVPPNEAPPADQWNWDAVETSVDVVTEKSKQSNDEIGASWLSLLNIGGEKESKPFANGKLRHRVPIPPQEPPPRYLFGAGNDATAATDAPIVDSTGAGHATNAAVGLTTPPSWYSPVPPNEPPPQTVLSRAIFPYARDDSGSHDIDGKVNDSQLTTGTSVLQRQVSNAIKSGWETFTADKQHISTVSKRRTPQENQISSPDLFFLTVASPTVATNDPKKTGNDSRKDDYSKRNIEPFFTFDIMPGVPLRQIVGAALVGFLGAFYLVDWLDLLSMMTIGFDNFDLLLVVLPFITATLAITKGNGGDLTRAVGDVAASSLQLAVTLSREAARTILKFSPDSSTVQEMMAASAEVARESLMATTVAFDHWRQGDRVPADSVDECSGRNMDCQRKVQAESSSRRLLEARLEIETRERSQRQVPLALGLVQEQLQTEERDEYVARQADLIAKRQEESRMRSLLQARLDMEATERTRRAISVAQTQKSELRKDQQIFAQKLREEQVDKVKKARQRALAHVQQVPDTVQQTKDERILGLDQQPLVLEMLLPVTDQQKQKDDVQSVQKVSGSLRTKRLSKSETLHQELDRKPNSVSGPSDDSSDDVHRRLELLRAEAARLERRRRDVERTVEGLRTRAEKRQRESEAVQAREVRMRYRFGLEAKQRKEALLDRPSSPTRVHAVAANPKTEIIAHQRKMLDLKMKAKLLARDNITQGLGTRKRKAALLDRPSSATHAAHDIAPKPNAEAVATKRQMLNWTMNGVFVARDRAQGVEAKTRKEVLLDRPSLPTRVAHAVAPMPKTETVAHERQTLDWKMKEELLARERAQKRVLAQMRMEMAKTAAARKIQQTGALDATCVSRKLVGSGGDVKGVVGASSRSLATDKPKTEPSRLSRAARHLIAALPAVAAYVDNVDARKP